MSHTGVYLKQELLNLNNKKTRNLIQSQQNVWKYFSTQNI